jgi:hypothetical protein
MLGIWPEPSVIGWTTGFADLANQTATADCLRDGTNVTTCDPYGRPFQPYAVIPGALMAALGLGVQQTGLLGVGLFVVYVGTVWGLGFAIARVWSRSVWGLIVSLAALTLAAISPPALLIIERGQIEILILMFATVGLATFTNKHKWPRALGSIALAVSVITKYFNLGVFAAFLAPRRWSWWAAGGFAASAAFLFLNFSDVQLARDAAGASNAATSRVMFGASTALVTLIVDDPLAFSAALEQSVPATLFTALGMAFLLTSTAVWWWTFRKTSVETAPDLSWYWIVGSVGAVALPYVLGPSNDYRLVLLLPALAGAAVWWGSGGPSAVVVPFGGLLLLAFWTNAWMIPNPSGWILPEWAMLAGEIAISASLAFGLALLIGAWTRSDISLVPRR